MRKLLLLLAIFMSAISAEAQKYDETPHFLDNWSVGFAAGVYHPMYYDLKYLLDCSGFAGVVELRKQITPVLSLGVEANGYYRMDRKERQDPRTVIGSMLRVNMMNLIGGYKGRPRFFEVEAGVMPAWGHLYRGSAYDLFPDENYFATKFAVDCNFYLGKDRAWAVSLKPSVICDITSRPPIANVVLYHYKGIDKKKTDLQLFVGFNYRFGNFSKSRHAKYSTDEAMDDEIQRLNESVNYLRSDVEQRDAEIVRLKLKISELEEKLNRK